jgi:amidase
VEAVEPPHFEEGARMWRQLVMDDLRRAGQPAIERLGDAGVQSALRAYMHGLAPLGRDDYLQLLARRLDIARDWALFFEPHPVLLMPNSWQRQFPVDADLGSPEAVQPVIEAQSPLLGTAMLGLPGLSVPTGLSHGLPTGLQLVAGRFREDLLLRAGEWLEAAAGFNALDRLTPIG